ncbi:MAG: Mur ligase domain-containing protein, partial [Bacteroidota bacterium]
MKTTTTEQLYSKYLQHSVVTTDSRHVPEGALFFALKGDNFNGNQYAADALSKGAAYAIIDEVAYQQNARFLLVDNVLASLQHLAHHHRQQFSIPVIGITGSNGK